jgi:hypothetical protein
VHVCRGCLFVASCSWVRCVCCYCGAVLDSSNLTAECRLTLAGCQDINVCTHACSCTCMCTRQDNFPECHCKNRIYSVVSAVQKTTVITSMCMRIDSVCKSMALQSGRLLRNSQTCCRTNSGNMVNGVIS